MIGSFINAAAILIGGLIVLTTGWRVPAGVQYTLKALLGLALIILGFRNLWLSVTAAPNLATGFVALLGAMVGLAVGRQLGQLLKLQKSLNRLGAYAEGRWQQVESDAGAPQNRTAGFHTATVLFCLGPLAVPGAIQDGLTGNFLPLTIKAIMDGLATMDFAAAMGWGALGSALPVLAYQGTMTLIAATLAPVLETYALVAPLQAALGILFCGVALVILGGYRIQLADYLPGLIVGPLLIWGIRLLL